MFEIFDNPRPVLVVAVLIGVVLIFFRTQGRKSRLPLPPGPPGNQLLNIPFAEVHKNVTRWTEEYGPVFTLTQGQNPLIVITRYDAAVEIMEKQGGFLVDRPHWIAASDILSGGKRILLQSSGNQFRKRRKALHSHLNVTTASQYNPIQMRHAKNVVFDIIQDPKNHLMHASRYTASVIMSITYGKATPTSYSDPEVVQVNKYLGRMREVLRPGAFLVDTYPILRYVPGYLRKLHRWHKDELTLFTEQLNAVRRDMVNGKANPSFSQYLIEHQKELELSNDDMAYLAGSMFGAGATTTSAAVSVMVMAAALFPEAQTKVQEELDAVIGNDRAPTFDDQKFLPQTTAFALETQRWRPVSDMGFPHRASRDIIWRDYVIPTGASVIGSPWDIGRDPAIFVDGDKFDPQRWLDPKGNLREDLRNFGFGFGRRVCPGQHVASGSIFINTALVLWAFNISEIPSSPIDPFAFASYSSSAHPLPFDAKFEIRTDEVKEICRAHTYLNRCGLQLLRKYKNLDTVHQCCGHKIAMSCC